MRADSIEIVTSDLTLHLSDMRRALDEENHDKGRALLFGLINSNQTG